MDFSAVDLRDVQAQSGSQAPRGCQGLATESPVFKMLGLREIKGYRVWGVRV